MTEKSEGLGSTAAKAAVTAIVTAVVAGIISGLAGWLPAIWGGVLLAARWVWKGLIFSVPVPLIVLLVLAPLFVGLVLRTRNIKPEERRFDLKQDAAQLEPLERQVLEILAQSDGSPVYWDMLVTHLQVRNLVLEQAAESLEQQGLIHIRRTTLGPQLDLTKPGRDFALELLLPPEENPGLPIGERDWDFELRAVGFAINPTGAVPTVEISFHAVNYQDHPLTLVEVNVSVLRVPGALDVEQVPLATTPGMAIRAKSTQLIICRRHLSDPELRIFLQTAGRQTASYALVAKAKHRGREYQYGPVGAMWIDGWVNNPTFGTRPM